MSRGECGGNIVLTVAYDQGELEYNINKDPCKEISFKTHY